MLKLGTEALIIKSRNLPGGFGMHTIKDVAAKAGVSIATVSNYINGTHPVSPARKYAIEKAMTELGYVPNDSARSLKSGQSQLVNILLPDLSETYHIQILQGAESELRKLGYDVNISVSHESPELEQDILRRFRARQGAGLIIISCQTGDVSLAVPGGAVVQIDRRADEGLLISCDYRQIFHRLSAAAIAEGKRVALMAGPRGYSCEDMAAEGYAEALRAGGRDPQRDLIRCPMSRDEAFFSFLERYGRELPDTVLCTCETAAEGVREALQLLENEAADRVKLIALGVSTWDRQHSRGGIEYVERPGISIGAQAAEMLDRAIRGRSTSDRLIELGLPETGERNGGRRWSGFEGQVLDVTLPDFPQMRTFSTMLPQFENRYKCRVRLHFSPLKDYLKCLLKGKDSSDVLITDRLWLYNLVENGILADISDYIRSDSSMGTRFLANSLDSMCHFKGHYYGVPFTCMPQILYYRSDLFTNPALCRQYEQKYSQRLRPPRTWAEYNRIAGFFTKRLNPESPVEYGCSFAAAFHSCFSPEFYVRLREKGGFVFDDEFNVCLDSPACRDTYRMLLDTVNCCPADFLEKDNSGAMEDFLSGRTAMIISFRSPQSGPGLLRESIGARRIGFAQVPGRQAVLGGWSMGLSAVTDKRGLAFAFIDWACGRDIAPYVAGLTGQSALRETYDNAELMLMYPWLPLIKEITEKASPIIPPSAFLMDTIPQESIADILYGCFVDMTMGKDETAVLEKASGNMKKLFAAHGYKQH